MRKWLYESVIAAPSQSTLCEGRVFSAGGANPNGELEDIPATPFVILRSGSQIPTGIPEARVVQQNWQVWVHDKPGSMVPVDDFIVELQMFLPTRTPQKVDDDWVTACEFLASSGDLPDDHYKTNTRFVEFRVTSSIA
jgi:hypothetical protein